MAFQYTWYLVIHREHPGTAAETTHNVWVKVANYPLYEDLIKKLGDKVFNFSVMKIYHDLEKLGHLPENMRQILSEFRKSACVVNDCPDEISEDVLKIIK